MGVSEPHGGMLMLASRVEAPLTRRVGAALTLPTQISGNAFGLRDGLLSVPVRWLDRPNVNLRSHVGLNLPFGSTGKSAPFRMISTGSVDPWLSVDALYGAGWLGLVSAQVRVPMVEGTDGVRQGAYGRFDGRVARRLGWGTVWVGASYVDVAESASKEPCGPSDTCWTPVGYGAFREVAAVTGGTIPLTPIVSVTAHVRVPTWVQTDGHSYTFSGGMSGNVVLGRPKGFSQEESM